MAQTLQNFDKALKEFYLPRLQSTINTNRVLMQRLERDASKTDVSGRQAIFPINIRPTQAVGARGDSEAMPTAQNQTYIESKVGYKFNYGTIRLSHPTIVASRNDKGSFIRVVGSEMDGLRRDAKNDINRQLFGWGLGSLGTVNGLLADDDTVIVMDPGHQVKVGMVLDSYTTAAVTTQQLNSKTVASVVGNNVTLTTATGVAVANNSYIFREDAADQDLWHWNLRNYVAVCGSRHVSRVGCTGLGTFYTGNCP